MVSGGGIVKGDSLAFLAGAHLWNSSGRAVLGFVEV